MPEPRGPGGPHCSAPPSPPYFSDQLTLFQPGRADYPHLLLLAPQKFFIFRHQCHRVVEAGVQGVQLYTQFFADHRYRIYENINLDFAIFYLHTQN